MVADLLTKLLKPADKGPRGGGAKLVTIDSLLALRVSRAKPCPAPLPTLSRGARGALLTAKADADEARLSLQVGSHFIDTGLGAFVVPAGRSGYADCPNDLVADLDRQTA